jgi:hypothetical protein
MPIPDESIARVQMRMKIRLLFSCVKYALGMDPSRQKSLNLSGSRNYLFFLLIDEYEQDI